MSRQKQALTKRLVYWPSEVYDRLREAAQRNRRAISNYIVDNMIKVIEADEKKELKK